MRPRPVHSGFTLVELAACLVVIGLLTATAVISLKGMSKAYRLEDTVDRLLTLDHQMRTRARTFDRATVLRFDIETTSIACFSSATSDESTLWVMPDGIALRGVRIEGHDWADRQVDVRYPPAGYSLTYAVELTNQKGEATCVLIAGLTGQPLFMISRGQVDEIFETINAEEQP